MAEPLEQAQAVTAIMRDLFQGALRAVYLHGSAVSGGLRPQSDIDLLAVIDRPMTGAQRNSLLSSLLRISGRHPARTGGPRCIELMVLLESDLVSPGFPARAEFIYGEWLRRAFETGDVPAPVRDPEITLVLAQARREARPLFGPRPAGLLPVIPGDHVRLAMRQALPTLLGGLRGDERNVLLGLARIWRTAATGEFVSKDAAATWAMARMTEPEVDMLAHARAAYLGEIEDDWENRQAAARRTAELLRQRASQLL